MTRPVVAARSILAIRRSEKIGIADGFGWRFGSPLPRICYGNTQIFDI